MSYSPSPSSANTVDNLRLWVNNELIRIANNFTVEAQSTRLPVLHSSPKKPQTGEIVFADGTDWNPGSGRGLYYYDNNWINIA